MTATEIGTTTPQLRMLADGLITFLETGTPPAGLFAPDAFCDLTVPTWRLQAQGQDGIVRLRHEGHPSKGTVPRHRLDPTPTGFVLEVEEAWEQDGDQWYCRELLRADVENDAITSLSVYCTGDWSSAQVAAHGQAVQLIRP